MTSSDCFHSFGCSKKIRRIFYTKIAISSFSDDVIVKTDSNRKKGKIKTNNIEIKMKWIEWY